MDDTPQEKLFEFVKSNDRASLEDFLANHCESNLDASSQGSSLQRPCSKGTFYRTWEPSCFIECKKEGVTPLCYAVARDLEHSVRGLLVFGADRAASCLSGTTPLMMASIRGNLNILRILLYEQPERFAKEQIEKLETSSHLLGGEIDVEEITSVEELSSQHSLHKFATPESTPQRLSNRQTIGERSDGEIRAAEGNASHPPCSSTPTSTQPANGSAVVISISKAAPLCPVNDTDDEDTTALVHAIISGQKAAAQILIDAGADVNRADKRGITSLLLAVLSDDEEFVGLLLDAGCRLDRKAIAMSASSPISLNETRPSWPRSREGGISAPGNPGEKEEMPQTLHVTPRRFARAAGKAHLITVLENNLKSK